MINRDGTIGGRTIEDIVAEFGETYQNQQHANYSLKVLVKIWLLNLDKKFESSPEKRK